MYMHSTSIYVHNHISANGKNIAFFSKNFVLPLTIKIHVSGSINPFPNKTGFSRLCSTSLLKTLWENEKLLVTSNFSFSQSFFLPLGKTSCHFHTMQNCRLQSFSVWKSLKFVVWERIKSLYF